MFLRTWVASLATVLTFLACGGGAGGRGPTLGLRSQPPREGGSFPIADPPPSRVNVHISIFPEAITAELDRRLSSDGHGAVELFAGRTVDYTWRRSPFGLRFDRGRVLVSTDVECLVSLLGERRIDLHLVVKGEPVITPQYRAVMQSTEVEVTARGSVERVNRSIEAELQRALLTALEQFELDVRPLVEGLHARISAPIPLSSAPAPGSNSGAAPQPAEGLRTGCAELRVASIESGPTVLAGGFEKDLGLVVLPSVTLPCARTSTRAAPLPLLANVASLPTGPFQVIVPVAAAYEELSEAMSVAMGGRLFFSREYPRLYLEKPRIFASEESLVIRLLLGGVLDVAGVTTSVSGELYFSGHPRLQDNQITVPDLELTPGTADGLLRLKVLLDGASIRDQARAALRLDVSERIAAAREKLSTELSFEGGAGCARAELLRAELTGVHPHASFLRIYVALSAQAALFLPCRR